MEGRLSRDSAQGTTRRAALTRHHGANGRYPPRGFLNRKHDGFPGPKTLWIGLQRIPDFVLALEAQRSVGQTYR